MESFVDFLIQAGPTGMFIAAFLAGSIFPFSSEVVMIALLGAGASPLSLLLWGTVGNILGSVVNYSIGTLGKEEWITRYAKVSPDKLRRGKVYVRHYGAWAGLLAWIPLLGSLVTVAMGYLRTNPYLSFFTIGLGKYIRYQLIVSTWMMAMD